MTVTTELFSYTYQREEDPIDAVDWSADGQWIACGTRKGALLVVDAASGKEKAVYQIANEGTMALAWFPDGQHLLTYFYNDIVVCHVLSGEGHILYQHGVKAEEEGLFGICQLSPDGLLIASSAYEEDGPTVQVRETETGRRITTFVPRELFYESQVLDVQPAHRPYHPLFHTISWSPRAQYIAIGQQYKVHIWNPVTDERVFFHSIANKKTSLEHIETFTWSPDERCLVFAREEEIGAFANTEHVIDVWDWRNAERWSSYRGHTHVVRYMQWLAGKDQVVSVSKNELHLWDAHTGVCLARSVLPIIDEKQCAFSGAVLSPDRSQLALVGSRYLPDESEEGLLWVWRHGLEL